MNAAVEQVQDDNESGWWGDRRSNGSNYQLVYLSRTEAAKDCTLGRYDICPDMYPAFEDFQLHIKEQYGGGMYKATIRKPDGTFVDHLTFNLSGAPKRQPETDTPVQVASAPVESSTDKLLAFLVQNQQRSEERLIQVLDKLADKPKEPEADPFLMVERVAKLLGTTGATPPVPKSTLETLLEAKQIQELLGGTEMAAGADGWSAITAALGPLAEVMKEGTINERLKLQIALKQSQKKAPAPVQPAAQVTAPQPVPTIAAPKFAALIAKFKPVLSGLIPYVEQGQPPSMIASALLASVPVEDQAELLEFLSRDDALNDMARLEPKVTDHWDWFAELANALIDQIEQATPDDTGISTAPTAPTTPEPKAETSGGSAGDKANATDHGKVNTPRPRKSRSKGASVTTGETA